MLTKEQIEEIREREKAATPGPWKWDADNNITILTSNQETVMEAGYNDDLIDILITDGDSDFILHTRTDIPALLAHIEEQEEVIKDTKAAGRTAISERLNK